VKNNNMMKEIIKIKILDKTILSIIKILKDSSKKEGIKIKIITKIEKNIIQEEIKDKMEKKKTVD
jgi:hypothetical protein